MKKALILAYDFPPYVSVGGLRPVGWIKYLKTEGVYPVLVTRHWDDLDGTFMDYIRPSKLKESTFETFETHSEYRVPYKPSLSNKILAKYGSSKFKFLRNILNIFHEIGQFFLPIGNKRSIFSGARYLLRTHKDFDIIIATGDPFVLHHYAKKLKDEFNIPCVLDFRDPWSQDVYLQKKPVLKLINRFIEIKTVKSVQHITTVSDFLIEKLKEIHGEKNYHIIANGFDTENIEKTKCIDQENEVLSLAFVGTICLWYPMELFLHTLCNMKKNENFSFQLNLIGIDRVDYVNELLNQKFQEIRENVKITPKISNVKLLESLAKNNILILFNSYSFLGTKIYDYLAINRKMLLLFTEDETTKKLKKEYFLIDEDSKYSKSLQEDLINECKAGIAVKHPEHLKLLLRSFSKELVKNKEITNSTIGIERYSRKEQTKKLAKLIHNISK